MVEANRMTDFVRKSVFQIVNAQVAIKADFPSALRVEANARRKDCRRIASAPRNERQIGISKALWFHLFTNQDLGSIPRGSFDKSDVCHALPAIKCPTKRKLEVVTR